MFQQLGMKCKDTNTLHLCLNLATHGHISKESKNIRISEQILFG